MPTAAAIIIGDEILSGKFVDENSPWLIGRCKSLGIDLRRICIISDEVSDIEETVARWRSRVDYVFTTGGVGPTHDDLTMFGIAAAFGVPLVRHPELVAMLVEKLGERCNDAALRMADVPEGAQLWWEGELRFPQVVVGNVCIFPGVPALFKKKFDSVAHRFTTALPRQVRAQVTQAAEIDIASGLRALSERFPTVQVGSYPQFEVKPWTVKVTLDSRDLVALDAAEIALGALLAEAAHSEE
ncbi:MAG: molybdenum cofactor synthesis domain-containing protein [Myxococcota bacterium]|jgi:molybdenum cofactor synthesis domain-containing protein